MTEEILRLKTNVEFDESIESYQYIEKEIDQGITSLNNPGGNYNYFSTPRCLATSE